MCVCIFSEIVNLYILLGLLCIGRTMEALPVDVWRIAASTFKKILMCVCIFSEIVNLYILLGLLCIGRTMEALPVDVWLGMGIVNFSVLKCLRAILWLTCSIRHFLSERATGLSLFFMGQIISSLCVRRKDYLIHEIAIDDYLLHN